MKLLFFMDLSTMIYFRHQRNSNLSLKRQNEYRFKCDISPIKLLKENKKIQSCQK